LSMEQREAEHTLRIAPRIANSHLEDALWGGLGALLDSPLASHGLQAEKLLSGHLVVAVFIHEVEHHHLDEQAGAVCRAKQLGKVILEEFGIVFSELVLVPKGNLELFENRSCE
jgi:hypothetical protein